MALTRQEIFEFLQVEFATFLQISSTEIVLDSYLLKDIGADSLDTVMLLPAIEEHFDIEIPDDVLKYWDNIGDIRIQDMVDTISELLENR